MTRQKGYKMTEEQKLKISIALKGRMPKNIDILINASGKFKKGQTPWNRGRKETRPEVLKKQSEGHLGRIPWNKGVGVPRINNGRDTRFKKGMTGRKSPAYKHGQTSLRELIRQSDKNKIWKLNIFERDNYTCQKCGESGCYLEAHHIVSFSEIFKYNKILTREDAMACNQLWDISNGITYCKKCHALEDEYRMRTLSKKDKEKLGVNL